MRLDRKILAVAAALLLVIAACGGDDDTGGTDGGDGDSALADYDLSGLSIGVGSKDFTEQLVLGEIMVQAFEEAGATVDNKVNLGGTVVAREALLNGDIDVYMEYNGTGWTLHLGNDEPSFDPEQLTADVKAQDLADNNIQWLGRSAFNDTYGFATGPAFTEENGGAFTMQSMADYLAANSDASLCLESEFPSRPDGLVLFEQATGYDVPESQIEILDTGIIYSETAAGNCDFGEIFTTDGRIPALELAVVEDDGVMIIYNVSMNVRDDLYQENPEAFDEIAVLILEPLTDDVMAELNRRVSVEGEDAAEVARSFLIDQGLISG